MNKSLILLSWITLSLNYICFGYTNTDINIANNLAINNIIIDQSSSPNNYNLDDKILRQEVIGIALKIKWIDLPGDYSCKKYFSDTSKNDWVCRAVELAADYWIVTKLNRSIRPRDSITKAEALAIIMNAGDVQYSKNVIRTGYPLNTSQWQIDILEWAVNMWIISTANWFNLNNKALRKEVFEFANNVLNLEEKSNNTINKSLSTQFEISDFSDGAVSLTCVSKNLDSISSGTGFLISFSSWEKAIFTNQHIFEWMEYCIFAVYTSLSKEVWTWLIFRFNLTEYYSYNNFSDFWYFYLTEDIMSKGRYWEENGIPKNTKLIDTLNYKISNLTICPKDMKVGTKVYIIGYPKFWVTETQSNLPGYGPVTVKSNEKIITDGIISGKYNKTSDVVAFESTYPYNNYYVSNKMDSGNSGWPALAVYNNTYCLLGISTWVNKGNFDNQGIVQNMNNIYYKK